MGGPELDPQPDYARGLLADPKAEIAGALLGADLLGFAVFFDLPEAITGERAGQLDDLFVSEAARGKGIARALIAHVADIGRRRGWVHLRWLVPEDNAAALRLYEGISEPAPWQSRVIWLREEFSC